MASNSGEMQAQPENKSAGMSRNYLCIDCKCTTRNPRLYLEHRRDFHKEPISIHECKLCVYASKHSQKLARHLRTVHRDVVHEIHNQSTRSTSQSPESLSNGFQSTQVPNKNTRLSTCKLCGLYTVNKTILMEHIRGQHPDVRIFECDQCDYSHYIRDRYNRHHRYHSMNQIQCKMCEFQTIYRWNLERHMRHHVDSISLGFRCKNCNFTASTKQSITAHQIAHHSGPHLHANLNIKSESSITANESFQSVDEPASSIKLQIKQEIITDSGNDNAIAKPNLNPNGNPNANDNDNENEHEHDNDNDNQNENAKEKANDVKSTKATGEDNDFDANAFLEVVMIDDSQPKFNDTQSKAEHYFPNVPIKPEFPTEWTHAQKFKYFYCINCNFRNEIDLCNIDEPPSVCPTLKNESTIQSPLYRCGYCHQTSSWKHVIERHCRLVHNTIAFIEKYSAKDELFQIFTPIKRRSDSLTDTIVTLKKRQSNENIEETLLRETRHSADIFSFQQKSND